MDDEIPLQGGSHASSSHEVSLEPTSKRREGLGKHNVHTHFSLRPKLRNLQADQNYKGPMQVTQWRSRTSSRKFRWLDNSRSQGPNRQLRISRQSLINRRGAGSSHPMDPGVSVQKKQNFYKKPREACKSSWNPRGNQKSFTLTIPWNSSKLVKISLGIIARLHHTDRRQNGIAERAVRRVKEGTSAVSLQSGLNESRWADSMECYTYLRNVTDLLSDGKTPYERRFGQPFKGPIIPFVSLVEYHPLTAKDQSRIHQFGQKVLPGLFLGYALYAGRIWKGDVLIADLEELETVDASEIYSKRLNAKEVIFPKEGEFIFPIADGRIKTPGGDQELRTSTLVRPRPIQGESHVDFLGEPEGSLPQPHDSFPDAGEAINDFWSMSGSFIYRHHVEPRVKLLLAERRIIAYSTKVHWRIQNYTYELGCQAREAHRWLLEYWCLSRLVWSLDRFHAIYFTRWKTSWRIYMVRGEINEKTAYIQAR